jgi:hypothetical protein
MTVYRCDHAWGRHGAREAARRGDIIVIVDVLSFSTAAVTALQQVSSRGESHPPALSEPDVNVSAHPAPVTQPARAMTW